MGKEVEQSLGLLNGVNEEFFKQIEEDVTRLAPDIEADPPLMLIKELMGEIPAQVYYLQRRQIEVKKKIQMMKLYIKAKRTTMEIEKSKMMKELLEEYQRDQRQFMLEGKKMIEDLTSGSKKLPSSVALEMLKQSKPEKPTQSVLDIVANLKTEVLQKEILAVEQKVIDYEELLGQIEALTDRYVNKKFAAFKHASLLENEWRDGG